jgi:hypothetical protein
VNRFAHCAVAMFFACSPVKGKPLIDAPELTVESMQIMPSPLATQVVGLSAPLPLTVMATFSDGTTRDVTPYVQWSSSAASIATVPVGNLTAVGSGSASIIAMLDGSMAAATVVVRDPVLAVSSESPAGIDFYDAFATGSNVMPLRSIRGANTSLSEIFNMVADVANNELYVADESSGILVFPLDGSGNIVPLRRIPTGSASTLAAMLGVAFDNNTLFVAGEAENAAIGEIAVFDPQSDGSAAAPMRVIAGGSDNSVTGLSSTITGLAVHDGMIYAGDLGSAHITVYPETSSGETAPTTIFAGSASGIGEPIGMAFRGNELYVADPEASAIEVYALAGGSNITPTRRIVGPDTKLQVPTGLALIGQTVVCAQDEGSNTVTTYSIEALEDQPPMSMFTGSSSEEPIGMTAF